MADLIIHLASDNVDSFILLLSQIALAMASFSAGVSVVFLVDFFKRHGWQYSKYRKKKKEDPEKEVDSKSVSYD